MVMVALWLPLLAIFTSFAIDAAHFWDFSRNLQNRANAAALAAGSVYGATCFGTPSSTALANIGETAQQYSGAPDGADVPYDTIQMIGRTIFNQVNLGGTAANFHLLLNASTSWDKGGKNFEMGDFCSGTYDPAGPAVDVWVTQASVPMFIRLLNFHPDISAHARVQLQGLAGGYSVPIAVPDPAATPCLRAVVINDLDGTVITDVAMNPPDPTGTPPQPYWTVTLPAMTVPAAQLSVQAYMPDSCSTPDYPGGGLLYDPSHGLEFINTYQPYTVPVSAPTVGTVWLTPGGCTDSGESATQDAYFYYFPKSTTCTVDVHAQVDGATTPTVWVEMDGGTAVQMTADSPATDAQGRHFWQASFDIPSESGRHTFTILWSNGTGKKTAFNGGDPLQATYAAVSNDSDPPTDSGPVTQIFVGDSTGATAGVNSIAQGTSKTLTLAFHLQGLELSQPGDPPIVLRVGVQNRKATGAFDCWGGSGGAQPLYDAIVNGCPNPVGIYSPSQGCIMLPATPLTCADLVPGNKRQKVLQAFQDRVDSAVYGGQASPCDAWQDYKKNGTSISGYEPWDPTVPDSRIVLMAITQPGDLSGGGGPTNIAKILGFATFYITGWDKDPWVEGGTTTIPHCSSPTDQDEPYPGSDNTGGKNAIWGHFIKYVAVGGTPNGQACNLNDVSACVAALTR